MPKSARGQVYQTTSNGVFVTLEGPKGCGKSTVLDEVVKQLSKSMQVYATKEPTSSTLGQFIPEAESNYRGITLALLIAADRQHHLETEIFPNLAKGMVVITDRYIESSLVLQQLDGVERDFIWNLNKDFLTPNLTINLSASSETLIRRRDGRNKTTRLESSPVALEIRLFHEAAIFLEQNGATVVTVENDEAIPLTKTVNQVAELIKKLVIA
jgi:dTMP kinase